ncbi:hypothetical protein LINPERHAP1_LOCUS37801, partial [Linum perenne]
MLGVECRVSWCHARCWVSGFQVFGITNRCQVSGTSVQCRVSDVSIRFRVSESRCGIMCHGTDTKCRASLSDVGCSTSRFGGCRPSQSKAICAAS